MLSLCHLRARSAFVSQKREGREGGAALACAFPGPFGAWSPARTVMGKASTEVEQRLFSLEKAERGPYKCLQISEGWVSGGQGQTLSSGAQ